MDNLIYLDNAATSWPKPESVYREVGESLRIAGANPGRGGHAMARKASALVEEVRQKIASFFHLDTPEQFVFTSNATEALNLAIKGVLISGDHAVTTSMEHNSVSRPIHQLQEKGVSATFVQGDSNGAIDPEAVFSAVEPETKLIVMTFASNVTGGLMPVAEVGAWARERGILFLVDAAQAVGEVDIDLSVLPVDMLAFPGHKALLGPTGTGGLYLRKGLKLETLKEGGTGTRSELEIQPEELPFRYESGTVNISGIAGLGAALDFLMETGVDEVANRIAQLTGDFYRGCSEIPGVRLFGPKKPEERVGAVSMKMENLGPDELAYILDEAYGIAVRAGLHCSPLAHKTLGTYPDGLARFSFSIFNTSEHVRAALDALKEISAQIGG